MAVANRAVFIVAAKRTPFGTFGGKLKGLTATDMGQVAATAALEAGKVPKEAVDSVIFGNVAQTSSDAAYLTRHISLRCGVPIATSALTINRLCGSGFQSIVNGAHEIKLGEANIVLTGGTESMSQAPYAVRNARWGSPLGVDLKMEDTLWSSLSDAHCKLPMALTAEKLADQYGVTREDCDRFALSSQQRWSNDVVLPALFGAPYDLITNPDGSIVGLYYVAYHKLAHKNEYFKEELVPMEVKGKKGMEPFVADEHPREATFEKLQQLKPVFKENGVVTAGNASGICDGAGAVIIANEEAVKAHNLKPLARVVDYTVVGVDPTIMGIGPAPAIKQLLSKQGLSLNEIDLVEVNEAFAGQSLSVAKELGLDMEKTNVNGGAIALGHPLAASGSRITAHLVHEMRRRGVKRSVGSACIGGGQGIALLLEKCN